MVEIKGRPEKKGGWEGTKRESLAGFPQLLAPPTGGHVANVSVVH